MRTNSWSNSVEWRHDFLYETFYVPFSNSPTTTNGLQFTTTWGGVGDCKYSFVNGDSLKDREKVEREKYKKAKSVKKELYGMS